MSGFPLNFSPFLLLFTPSSDLKKNIDGGSVGGGTAFAAALIAHRLPACLFAAAAVQSRIASLTNQAEQGSSVLSPTTKRFNLSQSDSGEKGLPDCCCCQAVQLSTFDQLSQ